MEPRPPEEERGGGTLPFDAHFHKIKRKSNVFQTWGEVFNLSITVPISLSEPLFSIMIFDFAFIGGKGYNCLIRGQPHGKEASNDKF
jgi:hypothetical protein